LERSLFGFYLVRIQVRELFLCPVVRQPRLCRLGKREESLCQLCATAGLLEKVGVPDKAGEPAKAHDSAPQHKDMVLLDYATVAPPGEFHVMTPYFVFNPILNSISRALEQLNKYLDCRDGNPSY
jgi:hypothetical protein